MHGIPNRTNEVIVGSCSIILLGGKTKEIKSFTLWCLIEGGVGISGGGGLEISLKLNKQGGWNKRGGVGKFRVFRRK